MSQAKAGTHGRDARPPKGTRHKVEDRQVGGGPAPPTDDKATRRGREAPKKTSKSAALDMTASPGVDKASR
jgi:hypothetical protein